MIESYADHQLRAKRQSRLLVLMFVGGVVATVLSFWLIVAGAISVHQKAEWTESLKLWQPLGAVTGAVALVVLIGSLGGETGGSVGIAVTSTRPWLAPLCSPLPDATPHLA